MRLFIAAPITSALREIGPSGAVVMAPRLVAFLQSLEQAVACKGHETWMAHRVEEFGANIRPPHICAPLDFLALKRADGVIAYATDSFGVHMELGWAIALKKPVVLIRETDCDGASPLLQGLSSFGGCTEIPVKTGFLADRTATLRVTAEVVRAIDGWRSETRHGKSVAFVSTAFGFGPVSKASTIAAEFRRSVPDIELDFFGAGIDYSFAVMAKTFDRVFKYDVDSEPSLAALVDYLSAYDHVVSVLNFSILRWWRPTHPPLHVVDSLTWMWPSIPPFLERAKHYFVQDYLLPPDRVREWGKSVRIVPTGPICAMQPPSDCTRNKSKLLVNLSGCSNPLLDDRVYDDYARVLSTSVLSASKGMFEEIVICTRESLHPIVREAVGRSEGVTVVHLPHDEFLAQMATCAALLTSPGITATLEAVRVSTPLGFLLPQNYSQYLLAERNARDFGQDLCLAFSRFGPEHMIPDDLPEADGVAAVGEQLMDILKNHVGPMQEMLSQMLVELIQAPVDGSSALRVRDSNGQNAIVRLILDQPNSRS